jgi:hypothetical protein
MKKYMMLVVLFVVGATALGGDGHVAHSTITYIIVPVKDLDGDMLALVAQSTMGELRLSTNGALAVLEFAQYKTKTGAMPTLSANDKSWSESDLEYNEKLAVYQWTHKETPAALQAYKQYSNAEILSELDKPEWGADPAATNSTIEPR